MKSLKSSFKKIFKFPYQYCTLNKTYIIKMYLWTYVNACNKCNGDRKLL